VGQAEYLVYDLNGVNNQFRGNTSSYNNAIESRRYKMVLFKHNLDSKQIN